MKRILIISAHPDDEILGCGGLISKYSNSASIRVVFIGEGSSCRFEKLDSNKDDIEKEIKRRNNFGIKALDNLNIKSFYFYNLPCGRLDQIPLIEINKIIENEIFTYKPDAVFTHSENDTNNDHNIIYRSTLIATRPGSKFLVQSLFSYEVLSSSEWNFSKCFEPNFFIGITQNDIENKINAMLEYKTEIGEYPYPRSKEGILTLAKFRGIQSNNKYAEAFKVIRIINK